MEQPHCIYLPSPGFLVFLREVTIIRKVTPINLIVHDPKTAAGKEELARRVSEVHADAVNQRLKSLNCPVTQKRALLDALIRHARENTLHPSDGSS